jgi:glycosyltransferase involved in cell wall biosynthesis
MPSVDIAIPNYNYGRYLRECVVSVLSQDIEKLRVLVIDNASTDDSAAVARELALTDPRVEIRLRKKNLGQHASFNEAIDWASGDYFLILCSDDALAPGALRRAVTFMQDQTDVHLTHGAAHRVTHGAAHKVPSTPAGWWTDDRRCDGTWVIRSGRRFVEMMCRMAANPVHGPTAVVRTAVQKRVGYYRPELPHTDDLELWLRFSRHGQIAETDSVQAFARTHALNQSASVASILRWNMEFEAAFTSFFNNEGSELPDAASLLAQVRRCLADRAYWSALSALVHRQSGSVNLMKYAIRGRPISLALPPFGYLLNRRRQANPFSQPNADTSDSVTIADRIHERLDRELRVPFK